MDATAARSLLLEQIAIFLCMHKCSQDDTCTPLAQLCERISGESPPDVVKLRVNPMNLVVCQQLVNVLKVSLHAVDTILPARLPVDDEFEVAALARVSLEHAEHV